ncbi:MAG: EamA family transporter RarD [Proteobacteria bacterium]|nr:EamA family transporter RarD [Pseudomonadota bacterium]
MQGLSEQQKGVVFCVIAHLFWGTMALYFGFMRHVPVMEIAVNRGVWALPIAAVIVWWLGQYGDVWRVLRNPKYVAILALTSSIIVFNWGFYIWSIEQHRTIEASLGYFINPLLNVVAGYIFLHERFNKAQLIAIVLAAAGVIIQTVATGVLPWLGLMLGGSFCIYGLLRKKIPVGPTQGFLIEVLLITPPLLAVQYYLVQQGVARFGTTLSDTLMLMGCGVLTSGALIFFAASLKRLRYSTAGLLQYISPSLVFLTAVFVFGEHMDVWKLLSFVLIWVGLAVYSVSALQEERSRRAVEAAAVA